MGWLLVLVAFIGLPILELATIIEVGRRLGTAPTVALVIGTGLAGAVATRSQGIAVLRSIQRALEAGRVPADEFLHGLLVFAGGLLLMLPGLLTDAVGCALVLPWTRRVVVASLKRWLVRRLARGAIVFHWFRGW